MSQKEQDRANARNKALERDGGHCVICKVPATEVHHIVERRLWDDGGYHGDNLASVCALHHRQCEQTVISVEDVRRACGITKIVLPAHLYADQIIDKWGNPILANGMRLRGELFFDPSVQKILAEGGMLDRFTNRVKFPRTFHLPWSPGIHDDDRVMPSIERFIGQRVIVHEKFDGENSSFYCDYMHARSLDSPHNVTRDWVKGLWGRVAHNIPPDWRVVVENLYAKHSIAYDNLPSYALGFQVWNERNECLAWDETREWLDLLEITACPVLYDGIFDERVIRALYDEKRDWTTREGYVVRIADRFPYAQYRHCVGKFVRRGHVQSVPHWLHGQRVVPNRLADK